MFFDLLALKAERQLVWPIDLACVTQETWYVPGLVLFSYIVDTHRNRYLALMMFKVTFKFKVI